MPAYHSKASDEGVRVRLLPPGSPTLRPSRAHALSFPHQVDAACGCALLPLRTKSRGPAPITDDEEDIVDEAIKYFRPNSLFRNFEVKTGADRTLIFLTLCVQQVSRRLGGARWRLRERVRPARAPADSLCELDLAGSLGVQTGAQGSRTEPDKG